MVNEPLVRITELANCDELKPFIDIFAKVKASFGIADDLALGQLHLGLDTKKVNEFRLAAISDLNSIRWADILFKLLSKQVESLLGPDLLIQKKINLSIQLPNDTSSVLAAHSDCNSGDSAYQLNVWIPLTPAFSTNSTFVLDKERSRRYYKEIINNNAVSANPAEHDFIRVDYGSAVLFPPSLIHGNVLNTTNSTRVSLNVRCKSIYAPGALSGSLERQVGAYYQLWRRSPLSVWAEEVEGMLQ